MASTAGPSKSLAWHVRAAQARRIASMLSPRDAQLAEAYAVECEDQARGYSVGSVRPRESVSQQVVVGPMFRSDRRVSLRALPHAERTSGVRITDPLLRDTHYRSAFQTGSKT